MRLTWILCIVALGCGFDRSAGTGGPADGDGGFSFIDASLGPDAYVTPNRDDCPAWQPEHLEPCDFDDNGVDFVVSTSLVYDTTTGDFESSDTVPSVLIPQPGGELLRVIRVSSFTVNAPLYVQGSLPLAIVSTGPININASGLFVGSGAVGLDRVLQGPGSNSSECGVSTGKPGADGAGGGGGGGGGSFGSPGGDGGNGDENSAKNPGGSAGVSVGVPSLVRGGCAGGAGGSAGNGAATAGSGGGAVLLLSADSISIGAAGLVYAGGDGGKGGAFTSGGGAGGGSGGMVVLDAPVVTVAQDGRVAANGGGGGEGSDDNDQGEDGERARANDTKAKGGEGEANEGGNGGDGSVDTSMAKNGEKKNDGGGGGGGGSGFVLVFTADDQTGDGTISPDALPTIR